MRYNANLCTAEFENKGTLLSGGNRQTKDIFDHDFIIFPGRIQQGVPLPIIPLLQAVLTRFQENDLVEQKVLETPETTPPRPRQQRTSPEMLMRRVANETLSKLCNDRTWRTKTTNSTDDAEWLESTNQLIQAYNVEIANVKQLLLSLGPKVPMSLEPDSTPVKTFFGQCKRCQEALAPSEGAPAPNSHRLFIFAFAVIASFLLYLTSS